MASLCTAKYDLSTKTRLFEREEDGVREGEVHGDVAHEQNALVVRLDLAALLLIALLILATRLTRAATTSLLLPSPITAAALGRVAATKARVGPITTAATAHSVAGIASTEGGTAPISAVITTTAANGAASQHATAASHAVGLQLHYSFLELLNLFHEHFGVWLTPGLTPAPRLTGLTYREERTF